jgi:hypothetical protein
MLGSELGSTGLCSKSIKRKSKFNDPRIESVDEQVGEGGRTPRRGVIAGRANRTMKDM